MHPRTVSRWPTLKSAVKRGFRQRLAGSALERCPALIVLVYHSIDPDPPPYLKAMGVTTHPDTLDAHAAWARDHFDIVRLAEGIDRLRGGRLPTTCVAFSFDDGLRLTCELAVPILGRYHIPATFFLHHHLLTGRAGWMYTVARLEHEGHTAELEEVFGPCAGESFTGYLRWQADADVLARRQALQGYPRGPGDRHTAHCNLQYLNTLSCNPLVDLGNHSLDHPRFCRLTVEEQTRQILENEQALFCHGNYKPLFAVPFGKACDWNFDTISAAARLRHEFLSAAGGVNFTGRTGVDICRIPCDGVAADGLEEHIIRRGLGL